MPSRREHGWLLDCYPQHGEMVHWFILERGDRLRLTVPFSPIFYIDVFDPPLGRSQLAALRRDVASLGCMEVTAPVAKTDFWTGRPRPVLEVRVTDMEGYGAGMKALDRRWPGLRYYNCDIPPEVHYGYATGLFPTAFCAIEHDDGRLLACTPLDAAIDVDYHIPPLREARLTATGVQLHPRPAIATLTLAAEGSSCTWEGGPAAAILRSFRDRLRAVAPDLIWTAGGDNLLMPALLALAERCRVDLGLDREPHVQRRLAQSGKTYVSYGRVLYHAPDYPLFGRWHIDENNSFWSAETGLEGLVEVARMSKLPVQRAARRSIGTGISSIQLDRAFRHDVLIPWKKSHPEAWKPASLLLKSDRGGLVYQPIVGVYENVVELDFVSMYPTIMVRRNVSPETVLCSCCPPSPDVPELGYTICRRRDGLVSRALEPIIDKRRRYKALMKSDPDPVRAAAFNNRQGALKWLLVCCFGYLGYRNARFGRIEAHESTCAFSRELLMRAKDASEARGFEVIHGIVDCLWLRKPDAGANEIADLCAEIERATDLSIAVEGRYRWIVFLPSRQHPEMPVPNRYFGCFDNGTLKYRGIEVRRSDQAPFVQQFQLALLERLTAARSLAECRAMREELAAMVLEAEARLRRREVEIEALLLRRKTSKSAEEYRNNSMTAVAARQARRAGIDLHAGESLSFLVTSAGNRDVDARLRIAPLVRAEESYDTAYYIEQLQRAAATVLEPLTGATLAEILGRVTPAPRRPAPRAVQLDLFGAWEADAC